MEFPTLGDRCNVNDCLQLDFLPIACSSCKIIFCKDHFLPFQHSCSACPDQVVIQPGPAVESLPVCSLATCRATELVEMLCSHCRLHFCLKHRHQVDHQCTHLVLPQEKMVQTAALVKQIQLKNAEKPAPRQGAKSAQLAAKVQLMKLKQSSKGLAELPAEERVYFLVQLPLDRKPEAVFVSKMWSVGKSIDYISEACKIPNENNKAGRPHLTLSISSKNDVLLKDLLDQQLLFNGQTVSLKYE